MVVILPYDQTQNELHLTHFIRNHLNGTNLVRNKYQEDPDLPTVANSLADFIVEYETFIFLFKSPIDNHSFSHI